MRLRKHKEKELGGGNASFQSFHVMYTLFSRKLIRRVEVVGEKRDHAPVLYFVQPRVVVFYIL